MFAVFKCQYLTCNYVNIIYRLDGVVICLAIAIFIDVILQTWIMINTWIERKKNDFSRLAPFINAIKSIKTIKIGHPQRRTTKDNDKVYVKTITWSLTWYDMTIHRDRDSGSSREPYLSFIVSILFFTSNKCDTI